MTKLDMKTGFFWCLCVFIAACGYRFSGSGDLPAGLQSIFISMFENRSAEVGIESMFTSDLTNEFILKRKDDLASSEDQAEGVLKGIIRSISEKGISQTGLGTSVEREVVVTVAIRVIDQNEEILWRDNNIIAREVFAVGSSEEDTEQNKKDALVNLSKRLAQQIHNRLIEDF